MRTVAAMFIGLLIGFVAIVAIAKILPASETAQSTLICHTETGADCSKGVKFYDPSTQEGRAHIPFAYETTGITGQGQPPSASIDSEGYCFIFGRMQCTDIDRKLAEIFQGLKHIPGIASPRITVPQPSKITTTLP